MKFTLKTKKNPFYGLRGSSSEQFVFVVIAFRLGVAVFVVLPSVTEQNVLAVSSSFFVKIFQNETQANSPLSNPFLATCSVEA